MVSIESLLAVEEGTKDIRNALKEDVSGPSGVSEFWSESSSSNSVSFPSLASYKREINIKLLNEWIGSMEWLTVSAILFANDSETTQFISISKSGFFLSHEDGGTIQTFAL
jgi:hypothetical protein